MFAAPARLLFLLVAALATANAKSSGSHWSIDKPFNIHFVWINPLSGSEYANLKDGQWDDGPMSSLYDANVKDWQRMNPAWNVQVWDRVECRKLVESDFPDYLTLYDAAPPIIKADLARLMVLLTFGGMYADLDAIPSRPVPHILQANEWDDEAHHTALFVLSVRDPADMAATAETFPYRLSKTGIPRVRLSSGALFAAGPASPFLGAALQVRPMCNEWGGCAVHVQWADGAPNVTPPPPPPTTRAGDARSARLGPAPQADASGRGVGEQGRGAVLHRAGHAV
jgi:hypothetical protein